MKIGRDGEFLFRGKSVYVAFRNLPEDVHGFSCIRDGGYLLVVNSLDSAQRQRLSTGHELAHIILGHLDGIRKRDPVEVLEAEAHAAAWTCYGLFRDL